MEQQQRQLNTKKPMYRRVIDKIKVFFKGRSFYAKGLHDFLWIFVGVFGTCATLAGLVVYIHWAANGHAWAVFVPMAFILAFLLFYSFMEGVFPKDAEEQKAYDKAEAEGRLDEYLTLATECAERYHSKEEDCNQGACTGIDDEGFPMRNSPWAVHHEECDNCKQKEEGRCVADLKVKARGPLEWKERKVNDIPSNPLECWYAVGNVGNSIRLYTIVPQYPTKDGYTISSSTTEPELYVLFEALDGKHISVTRVPEEGYSWLGQRIWDNYTFDGAPLFIRAFKTLDAAKARAEVQRKEIASISSQFSDESRPTQSETFPLH